MRLAFHCFYLKSRSLLLVYVGVISDSYTDYFLSRCLAKTTAALATMCKHKPKNPVFLDLRVFACFCGRFADFCGCLRGVLVALFYFLQILCKSALNRKVGGVAESDLQTQLQWTTLAASNIDTYMRGRWEENYIDETFKIIQFPWFLGVSVFDDDPKKLGGSDDNW